MSVGGNVPGYIFSGRNGSSSGTSTSHTGRGGTNVPGAVVSTYYMFSSGAGDEVYAEPGPNDWTGSYSHDYFDEYGIIVAPGAGGIGNLRGGGGGAGYCGGSGGIMYEAAIPNNVGGGGGGSSFLASTVNGEDTVFSNAGLGSEVAGMLSGALHSPSGNNGALALTYLGEENDIVADTSFLSSVNINGSF